MKFQFPIIKNAVLWIIIGFIWAGLALWMFFSNLRFSVQFTGGMDVVVPNMINAEVVKPPLVKALQDKWYTDFEVNIGEKDWNGNVLIQIAVQDDKQVAEITDLVENVLIDNKVIETPDDILELSIIGPSVGEYIQKTAKTALIRAMILMGVYILFAFSGMRGVVSPLLLGGVTIVTMIFDISTTAGAYGVLMHFNPAIQIDTIFIIALLTEMGYSIYDTIVIFDRLRENFVEQRVALEKWQITRAGIFEASLRQTMRRSLTTVAVTLCVIVAMRFFGTGLLRMFAFTLGAGIISGSYSSIFIAAPMVYLLSRKGTDTKKKKK